MKKNVYKFFVAGLPDAGKSTFVRAVSEIKPLETDVKSGTRKTTIAFDFGVLKLNPNSEIHIYGLPGQDRFSFIWEIIKKGAIGFVYLIPSCGYNIVEIVSHYEQTKKIANLPHIVAVTKVDLNPLEAGDLLQMAQVVNIDRDSIITIDPRNPKDVKTTLEKLIEKVIMVLS